MLRRTKLDRTSDNVELGIVQNIDTHQRSYVVDTRLGGTDHVYTKGDHIEKKNNKEDPNVVTSKGKYAYPREN